MAEEERQNKELLYGRISDEVVSVISRFPDVQIVPPDGFQSLMNGISQVWRKRRAGNYDSYGKRRDYCGCLCLHILRLCAGETGEERSKGAGRSDGAVFFCPNQRD